MTESESNTDTPQESPEGIMPPQTDGPAGSGNRNRLVLVIGLAVVAVVVVAVLITVLGGSDDDTIVIGSVLPSTGDLAIFGADMRAAIDLAVQLANDAGGVNGKQVEVVHRDSQTVEQVGTDAANALINIDGAVGIIGAMSSGVTVAVAQSATIPNGVLLISPASSSPVITRLDDDDYVFRTYMSDALQGVALADLAMHLGYRSVATTYVNNAYGEGLTRVFAERYQERGGSVMAQVGHESGQVSYVSELSAAADGAPDALVVMAYPESATILLREALEGEYFGDYLFVDGVHSQSLFDAVDNPGLDGSYGTQAGAPYSDYREAFERRFASVTGREVDNPTSGTSFDAAATLLLAIEHADSSDPADIRDSMRAVSGPPGIKVGTIDLGLALQLIRDGEDIDYVGAEGDQDYDENGDVVSAVQIWKVVDGQIENLDIFVHPGDAIPDLP